MKIYIDVITGRLVRNQSGSEMGPLVFTYKDILPLEIVFLDSGVNVTDTVLASNATLKVGVKARAGASALLAFASAYTIVNGIAKMTLSLATSQIEAFFSSNVSSGASAGQAVLEIEVSASDESTRETFVQHPCIVRREVNATTDNLPSVDAALYVLKSALFNAQGQGVAQQFVAFRREVTGRTGGTAGMLDAVATAGLAVPYMVFIRIAGTVENWTLIDDAVTVPDGAYVIQPVDNANLRWARGI